MTTWMAVAESLEDIDACVKILSTSPSDESSQHQQTDLQFVDVNTPVSKSCDNLVSAKTDPPLSRSQSCVSLTGSAKYEQVQSMKQYSDLPADASIKSPPSDSSKEEYLQEINIRLIRELEEKNATLQQLQENYEHLLLKYAEAQNKIDNLRFQSSANTGESSRKHKKTFMKKLPKPVVYNYKNPQLSECKGVFSNINENKTDRPSTLAVDPNMRGFEKELKAVTPTDSEGMSSVVTSMSGHSKILTNLDEKDEKKPALKSEVLEKTLPVFDKVTHWQNSLPPLDMIEKPESSFFDADTPSTKYNDIALSDLENIPEAGEWGVGRGMSQIGMKKYLRTLSLPSSLTRRNILAQIYKRKNNHTIDVSSPISTECRSPVREEPPPEPMEEQHLIQRRRKPHPFLRSASLPIYECESPRILTRCPVPPLDFENLTLSEDETSPISKETPSFLASHECSFQTLDSLNSCKATLSDFSPSTTPRQSCFAMHKSTSITPDRSQYFCDNQKNCCNVCGEEVSSVKAASYHGQRCEEKQPLCRSFSSTMVSSSRRSDPEQDFEMFASNLRARSQITMKALAAHVNNS